MRPPHRRPMHGGSVSADAKIASFAADIVGAGAAFRGDRRHGQADRRSHAASGDRSPGRASTGRERAHDGARRSRRRPAHRSDPADRLAARAGTRRAAAVFLIGRLRCPGRPTIRPSAILPVAEWIGAMMQWLKAQSHLASRARSPRCSTCRCDFALGLLAKGLKIGTAPRRGVLPRLSWVGVVAPRRDLAGHAAWRLAAGAAGRGLLPLYRPVRPVGQRHADPGADRHRACRSASSPGCWSASGAGARRAPRRLVITPALDLMQTIPTFAYLIPMLLLFGNSPVSAMLATGHLRDAADGARHHARPVARAARDRAISATMAGCTARQKLWRVLLPVGPADADGRRQPGHHAGAQHGDHLLDDRRRRPRL